jgi:TonB family protein
MNLGVLFAAISGAVYDPSGAVVPSVQVLLFKDGAEAARLTTGSDGAFHAQSLGSGRYSIRVLAPGFRVFDRGGIVLGENSSVTIPALLKLGQISETLTIRATGQVRAQNAAPRRVRVGGNVRAVRLLSQARPEYPEQARRDGLEGTVFLQAVIGTEGQLLGIRRIGGPPPALAEAAEAALRQWRYEPALLNGMPVEVVTTVEIDFRLQP